jgi:putative DNA methylase
MVWDFADSNIFSESSGSYSVLFDRLIKGFEALGVTSSPGSIEVSDAQLPFRVSNAIITTDPPYYDNIAYAVLSDFFYNWLRRSCSDIWPALFRRSQTQKDGELVATAHTHGGGDAAEAHFLEGMRKVMENASNAALAQHPLSIYYAFKQSEATQIGLTSAGWSTFLQAIFDSGLILDGTWPVRTEKPGRTVGIGANALASSIVLVCRSRPGSASVTTRREFVTRLKREMPDALEMIKEAGVGPVDMAQSALGPGMGIFTSYAKVLEPDDSEMTVRAAIALINEVREEILGEEDAHYDPETRFCIDWFQAFGTGDGKSGDAIGMANAYNLGLADLEAAGVFHAKGGVARIVKRGDMPGNWHPTTDKRLTHWECAQHLIRVLDSEDGGGVAAAKLVAAMNPEDAEAARSLAYRLYDICEKKGWAQEAQAYNLLAEEFPHLEQAALDYEGERGPAQAAFEGI